jgi:CRP-like cAMP-binding protein
MEFKSGMTVYVEGDASESVFILQSGLVNLIYTDLETGGVRQDILRQGEFFGVKSALGRYPREETAKVVQNSTAIGFSVPEFEAVVSKNPRIIIQMLKVYSNQLRKISRLMSMLKIQTNIRRHPKSVSYEVEQETLSPDEGLFKIGNYYFKKSKFEEAKYVFGKYLQSYPHGNRVTEIENFLNIMGDLT